MNQTKVATEKKTVNMSLAGQSIRFMFDSINANCLEQEKMREGFLLPKSWSRDAYYSFFRNYTTGSLETVYNWLLDYADAMDRTLETVELTEKEISQVNQGIINANKLMAKLQRYLYS